MRKALFLLGLLCGCQQSVLFIHEQDLGPKSLASWHVGSPDPRCAPCGQMFVIEWLLSKRQLECCPRVVLDLVYCNNTQESFEFPIEKLIGYETVRVEGEQFTCTGGVMTYRARILTNTDEEIAQWKHQLFVKIINLE